MKHFEGPFPGWLEQRPPEPLPLETVAHLIRQAAAILQSAHEQGIVHKNITPDSFLVRATDEQPDFPDLLITGFGQAQGTPLWTAPEQWQGTAIPASDQYALAIIAYQLLTWRSPFQGTLEQLKQQHLNAQPESPSRFNPRVPPGVDAVILHAMAKRPEDRFPSISAFADAYQQALQGSGLLSKTSPRQIQPDSSVMRQSASSGMSPPNVQQALPPQSTHASSAASQIREIVILALVFVLVVGGIGFGFFSVIRNSQLVANSLSTNSPIGAVGGSPVAFPSTTVTGTLYLEDKLNSNAAGRWFDDGKTCAFKNGTYHALVQQAYAALHRCYLVPSPVLTDVAIQVDVSLLTGDNAGILLRDDSNVHYYNFEITNNGHFYFFRGDSATTGKRLIGERPSSAIASPGQKNTLLIIAKGDDFKLSINNVFVGEVHDNAYTSGYFSLVVGTYTPTTINADASFSNLKIFRV